MKRVSVKRILIALTITLTVVVVVSGALLIWGSWITPFERKDLRVALDKIEGLQSLQIDTDEDFARVDGQAKTAVALCRKRIITAYDEQIVMGVEMQLSSVEKEHAMRKKASQNPRMYEQYVQVVNGSFRDIEAILRSHVQ